MRHPKNASSCVASKQDINAAFLCKVMQIEGSYSLYMRNNDLKSIVLYHRNIQDHELPMCGYPTVVIHSYFFRVCAGPPSLSGSSPSYKDLQTANFLLTPLAAQYKFWPRTRQKENPDHSFLCTLGSVRIFTHFTPTRSIATLHNISLHLQIQCQWQKLHCWKALAPTQARRFNNAWYTCNETLEVRYCHRNSHKYERPRLSSILKYMQLSPPKPCCASRK